MLSVRIFKGFECLNEDFSEILLDCDWDLVRVAVLICGPLVCTIKNA